MSEKIVLFPSNMQLASYFKPSSRTERISILGLKGSKPTFFTFWLYLRCGQRTHLQGTRTRLLPLISSRTYGEGLTLQGLLESRGDSLLSRDLSFSSFWLENRIDMHRWGQWQPGAQRSAICPLSPQYNLPSLWHPAVFFREEKPLSLPRGPKDSRRWLELELVSGRGEKEETDAKKKGRKSFPCFPFYSRHIHNMLQNHSVELSKFLSSTQTTGDAWTLLITASFSASHTALFCHSSRAFSHANSSPLYPTLLSASSASQKCAPVTDSPSSSHYLLKTK